MKSWEARVPLHLSILWIPVRHPDPLRTGSLGAGLILEPMLVARLEPGEGVEGPLPPSARRCLEALGWRGAPRVVVETPFPLGYGMGVSGSAALAACLAFAAYAGMSSLEAADEAHRGEVLEETGLGDVTAVYTAWGVEVRLSPGAPGAGGIAAAYTVKPLPLLAVPVEAVHTRRLLEAPPSVYEEARRLYERVREEPSIEALAEAAERFTSRWAPGWLRETLARLRRVSRLAVYKKGLVAVIPEEGLEEEARSMLSEVGRVYELRVTNARLRVEPVKHPEESGDTRG